MPQASASPGARLIRLGGLVTVLGIVLALVAVLPLVSDIALPSYFWGLSMLTGVGFALLLTGLARNAKARSAAQRELAGRLGTRTR